MESKPEKIVIIDDEERMCDSLSTLLTEDGYHVEAFQESAVAIESIRAGKVDLVISDIKMPRMDGIDILRAVKEVDQDIPVILMTGFASLETAMEAITEGAYDYLLKPVEFTYLELAVKRALEKRRSDHARARLLLDLEQSNKSLEKRVNELNAVYETSKSIGSTLNLEELLHQIISLASQVTDAQVGSVMLLDEAKEYLTIAAANGLSPDVINRTRLPIGESIAGHVAQSGQPLVIGDVESDDRFRRINKERYGAASLMCVPLVTKNRVIGVINLANKSSGQVFDDNDLRLLSTFASQAAIAVDDANQFAKNKRSLVEFEILHEISAGLGKISSLADFRRMLIEKLVRVFPIDNVFWFAHDLGNHQLLLEGAVGQADITLSDSGRININGKESSPVIIPSKGLFDRPLENIAELSEDLRARLAKIDNFPLMSTAFMAVPIIRREEPAFLLCLGAEGDKPYHEDDISLARLVISQAALLFEKERSLLNATRLMTMGNMISEISHDLRKPLTSIKGGLQILRKRWPKEVGESDFFNMADDEINRMNELVRELVDFSNPNKYETEKVDLRQVVAKSLELLAPDLRKKAITTDIEFSDIDWGVIINKNQILESLLNILINAIEAMDRKGKLTVRGLIEKPHHKKDEYMAVKITDSGHGIKKENLHKIFDRYYTSKDTGTGLGLAVVERIISAHGGTLHVDSDEGVGTTFTLYFPYLH